MHLPCSALAVILGVRRVRRVRPEEVSSQRRGDGVRPAGETTLLLTLTKIRPDEGEQFAAAKPGRPGGLSAKWDF